MSDEMAAHHPGVDRVPIAERFTGLFGADETGEWAD
jgi:hypothetical protein